MRLFISSLNRNSDIIPVNKTTDVIIDNTKWVIASRFDLQVRVTAATLQTSINGGVSFDYSSAFSDVRYAQSCFIFSNGNFLLMTSTNNFYLCNQTLTSIVEKTVKNKDGSDYIYYDYNDDRAWFSPIGYNDYGNTSDMYVWGNYTTDDLQRNQIAIFYTNDFGENLTVALKFNDIIQDPRHVHMIDYNPYDDKWIVTTGDQDNGNPDFSESLWMEGSYNSDLDTWDWNMLDFGFPIIQPSNLKCNGIYFREINGVSYIYWGAETNYNEPQYRGIWKSKYSEFTDITKHTRVLEFPTEWKYKINDIRLLKDSGLVLAISATELVDNSSDKLLIAKDFGEGDYQIKQFVGYRFRGNTNVNNDGYLRLDTLFMNGLQNRSFFIKLGTDLWDDYTETIIN